MAHDRCRTLGRRYAVLNYDDDGLARARFRRMHANQYSTGV